MATVRPPIDATLSATPFLRESEQLLAAVGKQAQSPVDIATASLNRQRAFTLLVNAYDQVRRAVTYLEWEEGAQDILCPSLYAGRSVRRKPAAEQPAAPAPVPAPAPPAAASAPKIPAGMPGSSPYVQ